jgi:hypothetical protein
MPISHAKVSGVSDGGNAAQVQPSDWNDDHSVPTLAEVMAESNIAGFNATTGDVSIQGVDTGANIPPFIQFTDGAGSTGGFLFLTGGQGAGAVDAGALTLAGGQAAGGSGAEVDIYGATATDPGHLGLYADGTFGSPGQALVTDGSYATWQGIQVAAGVPTGDPTGMPFAYDTTAVTGGFYFWDGAAWVKVATIL